MEAVALSLDNCDNGGMSRNKWYKSLLIAGTILILLTPMWWFVGSRLISPMICDPEDYNFTSGNYAFFACTDVYVKIALFGSFGNFIVGGLLIYFASRVQRKDNLKK